nr:hypothetical protein [Hymenobacter sp. ASUV-10]
MQALPGRAAGTAGLAPAVCRAAGGGFRGNFHRYQPGALAQEAATDAPLALQRQFISQPGDTALGQLFQQGEVPQYWLLGADGRILNSRAPRPSHPGAAAAIEEAIRQNQVQATGDSRKASGK